MMTVPALFAQDHKTELVNKITEKHIPLYAHAIEQTATINLSESMWALVLGESKNPKGYSTRTYAPVANLRQKYCHADPTHLH